MTDQAMSVTSRRALFAGAGAVGAVGILAACGGDDETPDTGTDPNPPATGGPTPAPGGAIAKKADIPVGGGKVIGDAGVVITQPADGEFVGYTAICTHQQCILRDVADGTINCSCHGSKFDMANGAVKGGPATEPLPKMDLVINGDDISLA